MRKQTSTNQLCIEKSIGRNSFKEDRYPISPVTPPFFFMITGLDGREVDIEARLVNLSKFGAQFQMAENLFAEEKTLEIAALIRGEHIEFPNRLQGSIVWQKENNGIFNYGVSFHHAIEINLLTAIMDTTHKIAQVNNDEPAHTIHPQTLALLFSTEQTLGRCVKLVDELENQVNCFCHEDPTAQIQDKVIDMVYHLTAPYLDRLNLELRDLYHCLPKKDIAANFSYLRAKLLPLLVLTPLFKRSIEQPLGYAGDHEMMQIIYRQGKEGANLLGRAFHKWVMETDSCMAVYGRRIFFYQLIRKKLENTPGNVTILSVASGPAAEYIDVIKNCPQEHLDRLKVYLLDQDPRAMSEAKHNIRVAQSDSGKRLEVTFLNQELGRFLMKKRSATSFDLIYSAGLFDYIRAKTARKIARQLHQMLNDGGELYLGNFSTESSNIGFMELVDWTLIYRTDDEILDFGALIPDASKRGIVTADHHQKFFYLKK